MPGGDREKDAMAVWMDCVKDNQPVPTWRNTIVAKVTRTGVEDDDDDDDDFVNAGAATQTHAAPPPRTASAPAPQQSAPRAQPPQARQQEPDLDIFGGPSPSQALPTSAPPSTGNLLDAHHHPAPALPSGGLLDMDAPFPGGGGGGAVNNDNSHSDFLGMTAPASGGYNAPNQGQPYGQQQQQQQQQNPQQKNFNNFNQQQQQQQQGPFGGLNWS